MYLSGLLIVYSGAIIKQLTIISPLILHALVLALFCYLSVSGFSRLRFLRRYLPMVGNSLHLK